MSPDAIAAVWLLILLVVASAYAVWLYRRSDYSTWESCLYLPTYLVGRLLWRVHFTNQPPAALSSCGGVLAANHRSSVDPFFVQLAARRRVHWMVAKEYCQHFAFGPLLRALQVIPTNRSGLDTAATKTALRITQAGRLVGMFPEGRINKSAAPLLPLRGGAALVACRSQVPLIPLWIEGSPQGKEIWSPLLMPARVRITFGQPIWPQAAISSADPCPQPEQVAASVDSERASEGIEIIHDSPRELTPQTQTQTQKIELTTTDQLADSDVLIVQWGQQLMTLANCADVPVELASQRKRRNRT